MASDKIMLAGNYVYEENIGTGTIKPGMLLEKTSTPTVKAHLTEGGFSENAYAIEDANQGNTVSTSYTSGSLVCYVIANTGSRVQGILKAGENVAIGAQLTSAGDGTLIAVGSVTLGTTVSKVVGSAEEALNLSGSSAVDTLIAIRIW